MKKIIIVTIIVIIAIFNTTAYAFDLGEAITGARTFIAHAISYSDGADFTALIKGISNAGMAIGTIVAIITGIIIAMKLMADGAEGKAQMKEMLTPYIIGCVLLFGSFGVWSATINIFQGLDDTSTITVEPYRPPVITQYIPPVRPAGGGGANPAGGGGAANPGGGRWWLRRNGQRNVSKVNSRS